MAELAHYVCEVELVGSSGTKSTGGFGGTETSSGGGVGLSVATAGVRRGPNGHPLVPSSQLVPGDVVVVTVGKMSFDGVLLEGETVMDETVLTGKGGICCKHDGC